MTPRTRLAVTTALAALVVLAAAASTPWTWREPDTTTTPPPSQPLPTVTATEPPPQDLADLPDLAPDTGGLQLDQLFGTLAAVAVAAVVAWFLWRLLTRVRRRPRTPRQDAPATGAGATTIPDTVPDLRDAVADARRELAPALPPRDAIVAAWVALEDAAAHAGTTRDPAQTPTEFTVAVLHRTPADPDAVATLRALYHRARFARTPLGHDAVHDARTALDRIAHDLEPADTHTPGDGA